VARRSLRAEFGAQPWAGRAGAVTERDHQAQAAVRGGRLHRRRLHRHAEERLPPYRPAWKAWGSEYLLRGKLSLLPAAAAGVQVGVVVARRAPLGAARGEEELVAAVGVGVAVARERRAAAVVGRQADRQLPRREVNTRDFELMAAVVGECAAVRDLGQVAA